MFGFECGAAFVRWDTPRVYATGAGKKQPIQQCRLTATNVYPLTPSPQLAMPHAEQRDRRTRSGRAHSGQSQRARCRNHDSMSAEPNGIRPRDPERSKKL